MTTLDDQIEQRKEMAKALNLDYKVRVIGSGLGTSYEHEDRKSRERKFNYQGDNFHMENYFGFSDGPDGGGAGVHTFIKFRGEQVYFSGGSGILSFIPGEWQTDFEKLFEKAKPIYEGKIEQARIAREKKENEAQRKKAKPWAL